MSYPSIIQKDLPLATWDLEETPTAGGTAACDRFLGSAYNGTYAGTTAQGVKNVPLIFGSTKSTLITSNTSGYALQIKSLDRLSINSKDQPFSFEFWIKFYSPSFVAPTTMTKIVGKPNSQTGIYIHNSSIVAIVGDAAGNIVKTAVQIPNIKKPLHIVMTYFNNSISLFVNGQSSSDSSNNEVITKSYDSNDEYFRFEYPGTNLEYALDHIAMYSRVLDIATVRRHMIYGFGYEIPNQVARFYGGYRYNMSMVQTPIAGKYERGDDSTWRNPFSISNMSVENGYLRIQKYNQPFLRYAIDKTSSVFTWDTNGLSCAAGGYVEIPDIQNIAKDSNYGFGVRFDKDNTKIANGKQETLIYLDHKTNSERYVKFFLVGTSTGEALKVQIDNESPQTLLSITTGNLSGFISCGFYYSTSTQQLKAFAGYGSELTGQIVYSVDNETFDPLKMRLGSVPVYSNSENYSLIVTGLQDKRFSGRISRITHFTSLPDTTSFASVQSAINTTINNYVAEANQSSKRFIIKAKGSYVFNIDLKRLAGTNSTFVGNHIVEWGSSSSEITITARGKGYSGENNWLNSGTPITLTNGLPIGEMIDESPGNTKYLTITIDVTSNDIEENPTKIYYFRIVTYPTTFESSLYTTRMICNGPDIYINSTAALPNTLPSNTETPFLFDEEQGGLYVRKTAVINYANPSISSSGSTGLRGISFFVNVSSSTTRVLTVTDGTTTYNLTYNGTTFTNTNMTCYVDGVQTSSISPDVWHHVVLIFNTRLIVSTPTNLVITFGVPSTGTANFYLDEIMTFDRNAAFETTGSPSERDTFVTTINNLYKGVNYSTVGDYSTNKVSLFDNESYLDTDIYQPLNNSVTHITSVDYLSSTVPGTYSGVITEIIVDGKILLAGDRILVPGSGIYTVNTITKGSPIVGTASNPQNSIVYIKDGNINSGKYYRRTNGNWYETLAVKKIKTYSLPKTFIRVDNTSVVKR